MLSLENLKEFTKKFQTIEKNIVREYIQHLFLSSLYKFPKAEKLLFKGETALRIVYRSPRFSEDLDFTGENIYQHGLIDELFLNTLSEIEKQGIKIDLKEAKPTTGGYLGIIHYELYGFIEDMKFEISLRKSKKLTKEVTTIINDYVPYYTILHLSGEEIVKGKITALLDRKKPRDYYDLYFFLRHPELHKFMEKTLLKQVLSNLGKEKIDFKEDLSVLLPISHQMILRDFQSNLIREIKKFT
ncbi:MAG: nucleotidyl transferase AbiEii/AbiGii toxin family protein [Candidatus Heimdallarchaeaceae archaeon]